MKIKYITHACFELTTKDGRSVVIDPYKGVGYAMPQLSAEVLLISHEHFDHNNAEAVDASVTLRCSGSYEKDGLTVQGFVNDHDDAGGALRGKTAAWLIKADGICLLHMGDIGAMPEDSFFESLPKVDVLLMPVGGTYTVDAHGAMELIKRIAPGTVIPMHYKGEHITVDISPLAPFAELASREFPYSGAGSSELKPEPAAGETKVVVLEYSAQPGE